MHPQPQSDVRVDKGIFGVGIEKAEVLPKELISSRFLKRGRKSAVVLRRLPSVDSNDVIGGELTTGRGGKDSR